MTDDERAEQALLAADPALAAWVAEQKKDSWSPGGGWNHRVLRARTEDGEYRYQVQEVYYDGAGVPRGWTTIPTRLTDGSLDGLRMTLERILLSTRQPVVEVKGSDLIEVEKDLTPDVRES